MLNFADNKDLHGGGLSESLTSVPVTDGTQLKTKIKPPRQAQEWSYFSQRESIGTVFSSPSTRSNTRSNEKTHLSCVSSARMAGNVCANVDHIRRQG
ncbi:hypothetical protein [Absidia glauca]|uniref:Ndc10 domain-containing protein n=1 Tax=Absidia glauca TaxID=4829 RepID=A0A168M3U6_ABSGL|nr:hypothetical protein [Absidia glauca]